MVKPDRLVISLLAPRGCGLQVSAGACGGSGAGAAVSHWDAASHAYRTRCGCQDTAARPAR